jgi:hypothetical protein
MLLSYFALTRRDDADCVAAMIAAWAARYLPVA